MGNFFGRGFVLAILISISACSSIKFQSKNKINASFNSNYNHRKEVLVSGKKDFYLWGLIPNKHYVDINESLESANINELSRLSIYQERTTADIILTAITFGLYCPSHYYISGFTN